MTARLQKLRRHYPHLTVNERVQLLLSAEQSGDVQETYALDNSCPTEDIQSYFVHLQVLEHVAGLVVTQLLAREVLLLARLGAAENEKGAAEHARRDLSSLLERQAAIWRGFVAWCGDIGYDPHLVLLLAPLGLDDDDPARFIIDQQLQRFEAYSADLFCDPEQTQVWRQFFSQKFPFRT